MSIFFDWTEISKSKKGVRTSDFKACGVVVSSVGDEIFVVERCCEYKKYRIPKSKVMFYNGAELVLSIANLFSFNNMNIKKLNEILILPDVHTSFSFDIIMQNLIFSIVH